MTFITTQHFWTKSLKQKRSKINESFLGLEKNIVVFNETFTKTTALRLANLFFELGKMQSKLLFINLLNNMTFLNGIVLRCLQSFTCGNTLSSFLKNQNKCNCDVVILATSQNCSYILNECLSKKIIVIHLCDNGLNKHKLSYSLLMSDNNHKAIHMSYLICANYFLLGQFFTFCKVRNY